MLALGAAITGGSLLVAVSLMALVRQAGSVDPEIPVTHTEPVAEAAPAARIPPGRAASTKVNTEKRKKPPSMAEPPPVDFIQRPFEYEELVQALVDYARQATGDGADGNVVAITSALHGAGGYGKTSLAQAVCTDKRVWAAFPDGILWVTLSEVRTHADYLARVDDLIAFVTGQAAPDDEAKTAKTRLQEALKDRRALLVIDDAARRSDVELFLQPGSKTVCLVITSFDDALPAEARRVQVDAMRKIQAAVLLGDGLAEEERADLREDILALADRLAEWPLLLSLAQGFLADQVALGCSGPEALAVLNLALDRLGLAGFDDQDPLQRDRAADIVLTALMEQLEPAQRERFAQLAVFAPGVAIPPAALDMLWGFSAGMEPAVVEALCDQLYRRSLLQQFDPQAGRIRMHEVVRRYLVEQQGEDMRAQHAALVAAYMRQVANGQWSQAPQDGYFFRWLAYHLAEAGQAQELAELLLDFNWLDAHLRNGGIHELLEDFAIGLDAVRDAREELRLVQGALYLTRRILARDPDQLAPQLFGRLAGYRQAGIQKLLEGARGWAAPVWLRPLRACFPVPAGAAERTPLGQPRPVSAYEAHPDDEVTVQQMRSWTPRLWDLAAELQPEELTGHAAPVTTLAISPDSRRALTSGEDLTLKVWDLVSGELLHDLKTPAVQTFVVAFNGGSRRAVASAMDRNIRIWSVESGRVLNTLRGHPAWVKAVPISVDEGRVISSSLDGTLKVWELETGRLLGTLPGHSQPVTAAALTPDGRLLISGSDDLTLKVWDLSTRQLVGTLANQPNAVHAVAISQDGLRAVSGSIDGTLRVWDLENLRLKQALPGHSQPVRAVAVTPDGRLAVSGSDDGTLKVWDLERGEACVTLDLCGPVLACAVSPDGQTVVAGGAPDAVYFLRFEGEGCREEPGSSGQWVSRAIDLYTPVR